jgi:ketosteroid isomerase-like protein
LQSLQDSPTAADFARFFGDGWAIGATDPERFFAHFGPAFAPDARLVQPLAPTAIGPAGLRERFTPIFAAIPDLRSEVLRFAPTEDGVLIEHTLRGTLGRRPLEWTAVDRFILRDGLIAERRAYFDPLPLIGAMLRSPRAALKLLPVLLDRSR